MSNPGIQVTVDLNRPEGDRVIELMARCRRCRVPAYETVQLDQVYQVAMSAFLIEGGDGYSVITKNVIERSNYGTKANAVVLSYLEQALLSCVLSDNLGIPGYEAITQYMQMRSAPLTNGLEGRITFCGTSNAE